MSTKSVVIEKQVKYGNTSYELPSPEGDNTHQWTIFFESANGEDLSLYVKKVSFHLHESFPEPTIDVYVPPYEVTMNGWGEFTILIEVEFDDESNQRKEFSHLLKVFPPKNEHSLKITKQAICKFVDPSTEFLHKLEIAKNTASLRPISRKKKNSENNLSLKQIEDLVIRQIQTTKRDLSQIEDHTNQVFQQLQLINPQTANILETLFSKFF
ncbi:protein af-9 [Anaeramoeba flamelloides]|uniref:Protein af-9 n=1 Tax=Anaeramoeba flamelloides TaxID=1746091 RepID=A0ABQ8XP42_9EUKA|nr:protein af-9 [Anaeramoeba flamelloides]